MNDLDLINMHDNIVTLQAVVTDLTAVVQGLTKRINLIQNGEVVDLWNHVNNNKQELQRHAGEQDGNSVTMDDLRNDINGVNQDLLTLRSDHDDLDHRVRFS